MRRLTILLVLMICKIQAFSQTDITAHAVANLLQGQRLGDLLMTVDRGLRVYYPEKYHPEFIGYFPVFEENRYALVYIVTKPKLIRIGSVSFNMNFDSAQTRVDTTIKELTALEYEAAAMHVTAVNEYSLDTTNTVRPNSSLFAIPMISAYGKKVHIFNWLKNTTTCQFGNDWEYTFACATDEIIEKRRIHKHLTDVDPNDTLAVHSHYGEDIDGLPVSDIATFCFFNWFGHEKHEKYIIIDENKVLELNFVKDRLIKYTHPQYIKTGHSLPKVNPI